ncbi:MAG: hypothetical protein AAF630_09025 [Cyanobacteria bacterium P01_C01_bin.38]
MSRDNLKNKSVYDASGNDDNNSGFVLGVISAILLIVCVGTLFFFNNKQVQRIIGNNINVDAENSSSETQKTTTLLTEKTLNVKAEHPNGTIGRLSNISFNAENTVVEIAVTNGFRHNIYLNLYGKGLILLDNLGNKYNLIPPLENPELKIESGTTFKGKLVFQGGVTTKADNLSLITNNQIGSDQPLTRRPKIEFYIPITQEDKVIKKEGVEGVEGVEGENN